MNNDYKIIDEQLSATEKKYNWNIAIGLQKVDNLDVSDYLIEQSENNIQGKISSYNVYQNVNNYYKHQQTNETKKTKEADIVSSKINMFINPTAFTFAPVTLNNIHKFLFEDIYKHAGQFRKYNITKKEKILNGNSVIYEDYNNIRNTLNYDFDEQRNVNMTKDNIVKTISKFTSDIWQVHPFCEGNTRTTAVFLIKYLRSLNIEANNEIFKNNSLYFRNALVRANYTDFTNDIYPEYKYLNEFFDCIINKTKYIFDNTKLYLDQKQTKEPSIADRAKTASKGSPIKKGNHPSKDER